MLAITSTVESCRYGSHQTRAPTHRSAPTRLAGRRSVPRIPLPRSARPVSTIVVMVCARDSGGVCAHVTRKPAVPVIRAATTRAATPRCPADRSARGLTAARRILLDGVDMACHRTVDGLLEVDRLGVRGAVGGRLDV